MNDKIYEPARHNEKAPAPGMAAVNTHMPEEEPIENLMNENQPAQKNETSRPAEEKQEE
mgnify:FL=1